MPIAPSEGARIHYTVREGKGLGEGKGDAVVLLQGLGLSSKFWFDVPASLADDPEHPRRVVTIDNRGTGESERPRTPWRMKTMATDVARVLDDAKIDRAIVVGISMGGMIAQEFALHHPSRVSGLVLLATTAGFLAGRPPNPLTMARLVSLPFGGKRAGRNLVRLLLPKARWPHAKDIFRDWPRAMGDHPTSPHTFVAHLFAASTHMTAPRLARIRCPTVVVTGDDDVLVPPANARAIARRIPGAQLEVVHGAGHALFAEDRDLVRRMVAKVERM